MRWVMCGACLALAGVAGAQTFRGYVQGGAIFSQLDGDALAGYHRLGGVGGAGVWYDLADRWRTTLTIAYAQNGSRASARESQLTVNQFQRIALDYVTVPVNIHYMDWLSDDEIYYRLEFTAGLEYRRLISAETVNAGGLTVGDTGDYRNNGLGLQLGAFYSTGEKFAIGIQHHWGLVSAGLSDDLLLFSKQFSLQVRRAF